jgi:hypothetical protein
MVLSSEAIIAFTKAGVFWTILFFALVLVVDAILMSIAVRFSCKGRSASNVIAFEFLAITTVSRIKR